MPIPIDPRTGLPITASTGDYTRTIQPIPGNYTRTIQPIQGNYTRGIEPIPYIPPNYGGSIKPRQPMPYVPPNYGGPIQSPRPPMPYNPSYSGMPIIPYNPGSGMAGTGTVPGAVKPGGGTQTQMNPQQIAFLLQALRGLLGNYPGGGLQKPGVGMPYPGSGLQKRIDVIPQGPMAY